ncbi:MAG TPA: class I SAM-dependent methyltransferase, partial [Allosphingosinicella sp.]
EPISQDHYLWFDMLPHVRARNLAEPLTRYRLNSQGLTASNGHNPRQRTHAIREALWSEVGLAYEAGADGPAKDISALLKHQELHDQARRDAAGRTIDMVLSRLIARRDTFMRDTERAEIDNMVASLRARLAKRAPRTPAGFARLWRLARTMGPRATLHLAFDRLTRRLRAHPRTVPARLGRVRPVDSLMALFHDVSPYEGLDLVAHPDDLQGWGSNDPLLGAVIRALRPAIIVEVGSWKGASAIHMARAARALGLDTRIVCVDTWLGSAEHVLGERPEWREALRPLHGYPQLYFTFLANVARAGLADRIIPLPNSSDNAALVLRAKGVRPELVYVDGAHEEEAVYRDLRAYWDLLAPGGALVGDDYLAWDGVTRAARRFAAEVGSPILGRKGKFLLWKGDPPRSFAGIPD